MLNNFAKNSIIDSWRGPECASESNSIKSYNTKSYKTDAAEGILKNGKFYSVKYRKETK